MKGRWLLFMYAFSKVLSALFLYCSLCVQPFVIMLRWKEVGGTWKSAGGGCACVHGFFQLFTLYRHLYKLTSRACLSSFSSPGKASERGGGFR